MYCSRCGKGIAEKAVACPHCGSSVFPVYKGSDHSDAAMRMLLPVGRSGYAIAAGYLGLFAVLLVFAPLALLFGILAIRDIKKNKEKHGMGRAVFGIAMGAIFSVVLAIFLLR